MKIAGWEAYSLQSTLTGSYYFYFYLFFGAIIYWVVCTMFHHPRLEQSEALAVAG